MYDKKPEIPDSWHFCSSCDDFYSSNSCMGRRNTEVAETDASVDTSSDHTAPEFPGLTYQSTMELSFAECFDVYYYNDGYKLLDVHDNAQYLVVPEGMEAPDGLDDSIQVLQQPLDTIYMAATSPMALFDAIGAVDSIKLSGLDASGWYIQSAADAINNGDMTFAGKYDERITSFW